MASFNEYRGYVKFPGRDLCDGLIRLDFNGHLNVMSEPKSSKLEGFSLRMFVAGKKPGDDKPEMSITLTPEQWLDLIDAMKAEFESVQEARKSFDR